MSKLAIIALGGNAIQRGGELGTIDEQEQHVWETMENLVFLLKLGYNLVITHGNGPQVGNMLLRNDAGEQIYNIPQMPLDICVADSQGSIGYMIERILRNVLKDHKIQREVVTLVTQTVVDKNDPAFQNPTKRIGRVCTLEEATLLEKDKKWIFKEEPKVAGGYRRVVSSPMPLRIANEKVISLLARHGTIVIASGGGGIPIYIDEQNNIRPVDAVIDKDLASALLGSSIGADEFYILTDVPYIYLNYGQPNQQIAEFLDKADTEKYLSQGMFGEGTMAPKIKAALHFINNGGKKSVITEASKLEDKKFGSKITLHYGDE
jgi:carbamate kinase